MTTLERFISTTKSRQFSVKMEITVWHEILQPGLAVLKVQYHSGEMQFFVWHHIFVFCHWHQIQNESESNSSLLCR